MCEGVVECPCCKRGARRIGKWLVFRELCVIDLFGVLDLRCAVHVLGGFCGRGWCFGVCRPCFGRFLWTGVVFWGVPSMFWAVFVDEGGVLGCVVHVLGGFCGRGLCFEAGFEAGFWGMFGGGAILKNRGVGFVGDCSYICVIFILAVVCRPGCS